MSDRTIECFSQYGLIRQAPSRPVDVSVLVSVEGTNNFRDQYSPAFGAIVSRTFGDRAALYVERVAIEKRAGGHVFQLNVSDSFATTMGQIARGGPVGPNWHLGFNISRKFY
jgi:uncharacterized beta barrel domain-containing protein DUF5777